MSRALTKLRPRIGHLSGLWRAPRTAAFNSDFRTRRLPVLDALVNKINSLPLHQRPSLKNTLVVYNHHALETSYTLLKSLLSIGAQPEHIFAIDKHYSRNKDVVDAFEEKNIYHHQCSRQVGLGRFVSTYSSDMTRLWGKVEEHLNRHQHINNILVMDHGGYALDSMPPSLLMTKHVTGIEKTTSGFNSEKRRGHLPLPIIDIARCATKKYLEAPLIAEAGIAKLLLNKNIDLKAERRACAVIGFGAIGKAVANLLVELGHDVIVFDENKQQLASIGHNNKIRQANELVTAVNFADLIFGCSGNDITASLEPFELSPAPKELVSYSSEDREFWTLLQAVQARHNGKVANRFLEDVVYINEFGKNITMVRGGFPVNFDDSGESVPAEDIDITRSLALGAAIEAAACFQCKPESFFNYGSINALSADIQRFIVKEWLSHQPSNRFQQSLIDNFENIKWIQEHSCGSDLNLNLFGDEQQEPCYEMSAGK